MPAGVHSPVLYEPNSRLLALRDQEIVGMLSPGPMKARRKESPVLQEPGNAVVLNHRSKDAGSRETGLQDLESGVNMGYEYNNNM